MIDSLPLACGLIIRSHKEEIYIRHHRRVAQPVVRGVGHSEFLHVIFEYSLTYFHLFLWIIKQKVLPLPPWNRMTRQEKMKTSCARHWQRRMRHTRQARYPLELSWCVATG